MVSGFRIERLIGRGTLGAVYEATQLSLGRTVALRFLDGEDLADPDFAARFAAQQRLAASLHNPNIVPTYEAGSWEGGRFVATRFIRGRTVADLLDSGSLGPERSAALLEAISAALGAAHRAGLVHGRITAANVLVDAAGTPYLADLGLGRPGDAETDAEALAELTARVQRSGGRRRVPALAAIGGAALVAAALVAVLAGGGGDAADASDAPPPALAAGTVPFGSDLAAGDVASLGCDDDPGPNTPACTLAQSTFGGRPSVVRRSGVIRGWAVRGAAGDLALQVVGHRGDRVVLRAFSQVERVPDTGPQAFATNLRVERGDSVGVLLAPGATIGSRDPHGTSALQWDGTLSYTPQRQVFSRIDRELLLRVDIDPGGRPELSQVSGREARLAPEGEPLGETSVELPEGRAIRIVLVRVGARIAIDAFHGGRRLARVDVPDARTAGRVLFLEGSCGYQGGFCLRWLNEGDPETIVHAYRLADGGGAFRLIG